MDVPEDFWMGTKFIATGDSHTCAQNITDINHSLIYILKCFGNDTQGQTTIPAHVKASLEKGQAEITTLAAAANNTCIVIIQSNCSECVDESTIECWGDTANGVHNVPLEFKTNIDALDYSLNLSMGEDTVCAIRISNDKPDESQGGDTNDYDKNDDVDNEVDNEVDDNDINNVNNNNTNDKNTNDKNTNDKNTNDKNTKQSAMNMNKSSNPPNPTLSRVSALNLLKCWGKCTDNLCTIPQQQVHTSAVVSTGLDHACVINFNNTTKHHTIFKDHWELSCWGNDQHGQTDVPPVFKGNIVQVITGAHFTCAMKMNWYLACWGINSHTYIPDVIQNHTRLIHAGGRHACKVSGGELRCWGNDEFNQLSPPAQHVHDAVQVAAGWDYTCLATTSHKMACWGFNLRGQATVPKQLTRGTQAIESIHTGMTHTCARYTVQRKERQKTILACWGGNNEFKQLYVPQLWLFDAQGVAVGDEHTCAFRHPGSILDRVLCGCWGHNEQGQTEVPEMVRGNEVAQVEAGSAHSCARVVSSLFCWGSDAQGQLKVPAHVAHTALQLSAGVVHTCAVQYNISGDSWAMDSSVHCWGHIFPHLVADPFLPHTQLVSAGFDFNCALQERGQAHCWGENEYNQCDADQQYRLLED